MLSGAMLDDCGSAAKLSASSSPRDESVDWRTRDCSIHRTPRQSEAATNLLRRKLDSLFFFARDEIVSDNIANPQRCNARTSPRRSVIKEAARCPRGI